MSAPVAASSKSAPPRAALTSIGEAPLAVGGAARTEGFATPRQRLGHYLELTKARLSSLVVLTTAAGFTLSSHGHPSWSGLAWTVAGTALAAGGANALNEWIERDLDAKMERTCHRPVPTGALSSRHALGVALGAAVLGPIVLAVFTNLLTAALAALTILLYVFVYTPLKRVSTACTLVGAVCGAIPPVMGCTSAGGRIDTTAWLLFVLLFLWQIPHFLSLAWLYRDDYARGGFKMFPLVDESGVRTTRMVVLYTLALIPLGFAMALGGLGGWWFVAGSIVLGAAFSSLALRFFRDRSDGSARRMFLGSLVYLPLMLSLLVLDRGPAPGLAFFRAGAFAVQPPHEIARDPLAR
jgi:protoheme IX farnesyltransferase